MMRTTVNLDDDIMAELERRRRAEGLGLSEALNALARRGLRASRERREPFVQRTARLGINVDVTNVGDVLELLDEADDDRKR